MRRFMPVDTATAALGGERAFKFCAAHKFQFLTVHKLRFSETPLNLVFSVGCGLPKITTERTADSAENRSLRTL